MESSIKVLLVQTERKRKWKRKRKKTFCILHPCMKYEFLFLYLDDYHLTWVLPLEYSNVSDGDCSRNRDE